MDTADKIIAMICDKKKIMAEMNVFHLSDTDHPRNDDHRRYQYLQKRLQLIDTWMLLLDSDQKFIIEQHLVNGMCWPTLTNEYEKQWPDAPKVLRTLVRKQSDALEKIVDFTESHLDELGYLLEDTSEQHKQASDPI